MHYHHIKIKIFRIIFFLLSVHIYSETILDFKTISDYTDDLYDKIENEEHFQLLLISELEAMDIFRDENILSLDYEYIWYEADSLAGLQSQYLNSIDIHNKEFVFVTLKQFMARSFVLSWAIEDEEMINEGQIPFLAHQFGNEIVGLTLFLGRLFEFLDDSDKSKLSEHIVKNALCHKDLFSYSTLSSFDYLFNAVLTLNLDEKSKNLFQDALREISEYE